jgi:hypothetical protein
MANTPHDDFAKSYLEELLSAIGQVHLDRPVKSETRRADIWFVPEPARGGDRADLGVLGHLAETACFIEPFRNPATWQEIRDCIGKLISLLRALTRKAKVGQAPLVEADLPRLWILVPTASAELRRAFGAVRRRPWTNGIYLCPLAFRTGLVVIHQLPKTPDTLWMRLLGRGRVQKQAIRELEVLPSTSPRKAAILELLADWRAMLEIRDLLTQDEEELIMNLSPVYQQRRQEWRQEGVQEGHELGVQEGHELGVQEGHELGVQEGRQIGQRELIEGLFQERFGRLDDELLALIDRLLATSPDQYTRLLIQASREELLAQFPPT